MSPEVVEQFVLNQLDRASLGHNTFTPEALALIIRSGEGLLRCTRKLCLGALIEPDLILECGNKGAKGDKNLHAISKIGKLMKQFLPGVLVLQDVNAKDTDKK